MRVPVTDPVEARIFDFYIKEAGPWLDIVSPEGHMSKTVPALALTDRVLYSACLAYASHVLYLLGQVDKAVEETYSNNAINLLIPKLSEDPRSWSEGSILPTTVLLRVSEQFSEIGDDQQYHLNGAFSVSASAGRTWGIDRLDLETIAFWTYLRMTLRVCFLCEQGTKCDTDLIREGDFVLTDASEAGLTNRISHLLAKVCNACWAPNGDMDRSVLENLQADLGQWRASLPATFDPWAIFNIPDKAFATVKYLSTWHAIAWQFYYAAEVLLAVHIALFSPPATIIGQNQYLEQKVLVRTRKLCGVTFSTDEIGVQINGAHLVAWCGQFFISKHEQAALLEWLDRLMARTKWPNKTCADRLRRIWSGQQGAWTTDPAAAVTEASLSR